MKLFLIPISTRRTLVYAQQFSRAAGAVVGKQSLLDRVTAKTSATWHQWEHGPRKWQRSLVEAGNKLLMRIPYEEWGLKSIPPLTHHIRNIYSLPTTTTAGTHPTSITSSSTTSITKVDVQYPPSVIPSEKVPVILRQLATERASLHRSRLWWSIIGMPIVAPFALVPLIPNIPFFYLAFRAYSHWKALAGGKHLMFLLTNNLINPTPCQKLDAVYHSRKRAMDGDEKGQGSAGKISEEEEEILLSREDAHTISREVDLPELDMELQRAHDQVEKNLNEVAAARKEVGEGKKS